MDDDEKRATIVRMTSAFRAVADVVRMGAPVTRCARCGDPSPCYDVRGRCPFCEVNLCASEPFARERFVCTGLTR